jgi:transcription antitermination factor NusG
LKDFGYEEFLPLRKIRQLGGGLFSHTPLFPGYTLCKIDLTNGPKLYHVPGFIRIVGAGKSPIPIENHEIEAIKKIHQSCLDFCPCAFGTPGEKVRITRGPLAGIDGIIENCKNRQIVVSVSLLRRAVAVAIEPEWLTYFTS